MVILTEGSFPAFSTENREMPICLFSPCEKLAVQVTANGVNVCGKLKIPK